MSKRLHKWIVAVTLLCASSFIFAINKSTWSVSSDSIGVRYAANGKLAAGHQYGFLKIYKKCDSDMLWVLLSSKDAAVKKLKGTLPKNKDGKDMEIAILIDGGSALTIPLEYFQYTDVPPNYVATVFTNTPMNSKFIDLMKKSKKVAVKVQSPENLAGMMQVAAEEFDLAGMSAARDKAYKQCKAGKK
jgi:hypothetical protein